MNNNTPKVSLSFTKTIGKRKLQTSALGPEKPESKQTIKEAITCFDKNVKISEPPKPEDALIIPLVESTLETPYKNVKKDLSSDIPTKIERKNEEMSIDEQAAAAVIEESTRKLEELRNADSLQQQSISIMNGVSDTTLENYDQVNVIHFGAAMLRGMGWNKGQGLGKNNKRVVEIIDPTSRSHLSLSSKKKKLEKSEADGEELELKNGCYVLIEEGRNRGSYGTVESVDEDHVLIRLAREEKVIRDVEQNIRVASTKEYKEFSRVINKAMYDDYKASESNKSNKVKKEKYSDDDSKDLKKKERKNDHMKEKSLKIVSESKDVGRDIEKPERSLKDDDKLEKKFKDKLCSKDDKERYREKIDWKNSDYKRKTEERKYKIIEKEYKDKKKKSHLEKLSSYPELKPEIPWATENLRVRIIDKVYKGGKYHKEKVVIRSIDTVENCTCITNEGKVLYDVNPSHLETVIPKSSAIVFIVKGTHKGQKARILELHKEKEKATIQLLEESSVILKLYYDDICEYVSR